MRPSRPRCQPATGYGLMELVTVLCVLGVVAGMALPGLQRVLDRVRADSLRMQLHSVLASARSTAITRRKKIGACPSSDGRQCGSDWAHGWLLFEVAPGTPPGAPPTDPFLVEQRPRSPVQAIASKSRKRIHFRPDGRNAGTNDSVKICLGEQLHSKVVVSVPGRVRSERPRRPTPCAR